MKILIQGPGAIGLLLAARLKRVQESLERATEKSPLRSLEIAILDRNPERAAALAQQGLQWREVSGEQGVATIPLYLLDASRPENVGDPRQVSWDLIIVCVKAYDVDSAFDALQELVGCNTSVLTLSNGLGVEGEAHYENAEARWGRERVLAGTLSSGASVRSTRDASPRSMLTQVTCHGDGILRLGSSGAGDSAADAASASLLQPLAAIFEDAGFEVEVVADIAAAVWEKVAVNCAINALGGVLGVENGKLTDSPILALAARVACEVAAVRHACTQTEVRFDRDGTEIDRWTQRVADVCRQTAKNRCSMLSDLDSAQRTEIDHLNGAIVRLAEKLSIEVPLNQSFSTLVRALERKNSNSNEGREESATTSGVDFDDMSRAILEQFELPRNPDARTIGKRWLQSPESIIR